jgi:hypothetical protein
VQRSSLSFAGGRVRRPYPEGSAAADSGTRRRASVGTAGQARSGSNAPDDVGVSGRRIVTDLRQGVSETIGLGQSFHRERSRWREPTWDLRAPDWPLTRGTSTGRLTQVSLPSAARHIAERRCPSRESYASGRPRVWCCRVRAAVVVLVDRNGCRSRQAACGPSRPCAKSAWTTSTGLASRRESAGR